MPDDQALRDPGVGRTLFDPACGTGGMLAVPPTVLAELNPKAHLDDLKTSYGPDLYRELNR